MADLRVTGGLPSPIKSAPGGAERAETARAAQRAFFQAALNATAPTVAVRPADSQPTARAPAPSASAKTSPAEPGRYARPGSLLDIKV